MKSSGALGLPADDDNDPNDEKQQQHSHCCEHGVSREHLAGPLGQDQAQDGQQENCRVKVEENRLDPEDKDVRTLGHTPPQAAHLRKGHRISKVGGWSEKQLEICKPRKIIQREWVLSIYLQVFQKL